MKFYCRAHDLQVQLRLRPMYTQSWLKQKPILDTFNEHLSSVIIGSKQQQFFLFFLFILTIHTQFSQLSLTSGPYHQYCHIEQTTDTPIWTDRYIVCSSGVSEHNVKSTV